jgi:hypothetical protein
MPYLHKQAVDSVQDHMKAQPRACRPGFGKHQKKDVNPDCGKAVQGMETEAAPVGIVYWVCKQMIGIDNQRGNHDGVSFHPLFSEKQ